MWRNELNFSLFVSTFSYHYVQGTKIFYIVKIWLNKLDIRLFTLICQSYLLNEVNCQNPNERTKF